MDPDVDILFTEYTLNDGIHDNIAENPVTAAYERLVRRALGLSKQPAVVMLNVSGWEVGRDDRGRGRGRNARRRRHDTDCWQATSFLQLMPQGKA